jgi:hypothetical protein
MMLKPVQRISACWYLGQHSRRIIPSLAFMPSDRWIMLCGITEVRAESRSLAGVEEFWSH